MSSIGPRLTLNRIIVGYVIAYLSFLPWIYKHTKIRERDPDALQPESRLYWLLWSKSWNISWRSSTDIEISSCTTRNYRSVRVRLDQYRSPSQSLDSADDILRLHCNSKRGLSNTSQSSFESLLTFLVRNLYGYNWLHGCSVWTVFRFGYRWKCIGSRLPCRYCCNVFNSQ